MDGFRSFRPDHICYALSASNAAPIGATFIAAAGSGDCTFMIDNATGSGRAFIGFGMTSDVAIANAVVPVIGGNARPSLPVAAGTVQTFTFNGNGIFAAARTDGAGSTIYLAIGDGV